MTTNRESSQNIPSAKTCALDVGGGPDASIVLDVAKSQLIAATARGLELLTLAPTTSLPLTLDGAMPALQRLRHTAANDPSARHSDLIFWIGDGVVRLDGVARFNVGNVGERLLVVGLQPAFSTANSPPEMNPAPSTLQSLDEIKISEDPLAKVETVAPEITASTLPPAPRDDAQTLKDIARAIREGQNSGRTAVDLELTPEPPATGQAIAKLEPASVQMQPRPLKQLPLDGFTGVSLAKLAHELKTPLSAILAAAEIMRDERLGTMGNRRYLGYAGDIHDSASHALDVIGKMLDGGGPVEHPRPPIEAIDINELCRRVVSSMKPLAKGRQLSLELEALPRLQRVSADPVALRQIVINLITNALKFTPPGGEVHVVTGYLDDGSLFLVVRDTGDGMTGHAMAHAFDDDILDPSSGAEPACARPGGGHGIGLPLVRQLARDNHAALEIDSEPGKGTVVLLAFPPSRLSDL